MNSIKYGEQLKKIIAKYLKVFNKLQDRPYMDILDKDAKTLDLLQKKLVDMQSKIINTHTWKKTARTFYCEKCKMTVYDAICNTDCPKSLYDYVSCDEVILENILK